MPQQVCGAAVVAAAEGPQVADSRTAATASSARCALLLLHCTHGSVLSQPQAPQRARWPTVVGRPPAKPAAIRTAAGACSTSVSSTPTTSRRLRRHRSEDAAWSQAALRACLLPTVTAPQRRAGLRSGPHRLGRHRRGRSSPCRQGQRRRGRSRRQHRALAAGAARAAGAYWNGRVNLFKLWNISKIKTKVMHDIV